MAEQAAGWKISVVVPVYNGGAAVGATIEHLLDQTLRPDEIIVVDDGSSDDTAEVLRRFGERITLISKPNGGPASARNVGVRAASGTLVAFTDSDCFPDKDWLRELVKGFYAPEIVGAGGTVRGAYPGLVGEFIDMNRGLDPGFERGGVVTRLVTANACFRRDALLEANVFDERFRRPGGEDTELSVRLRNRGYALAYVSGAVVRHRHKRTIREYLVTAANYGEGQYILERLWPQCSCDVNHRRQLVRGAIAARSMVKFCLRYRKRYDWRRAALFSFLDHYWHVAYSWGFLRGRRNRELLCSLDAVSENSDLAGPYPQISPVLKDQ